jgi:hypothetical protein
MNKIIIRIDNMPESFMSKMIFILAIEMEKLDFKGTIETEGHVITFPHNYVTALVGNCGEKGDL